MDVAMTERHWPSTQNKDDRGPGDRPQADSLRRVPLSRILGGDREIVIEFNGADYRLRITRNQKLILTK
jgi:hemin uptake protein HemP